ncbi:TonB-dependent hemoglobin/transferrin/lactoferrin family receptor [Tardiphaga sp. 804_B3_N1_9]|uniref:TonB-dependent receptor n=1 Tax=Tardiphaga TaxID=1395974 RepID=UPI0015868F79|nr:TonB-dependent receptor [Tardiphaga robiniae]NUU40512.1 TonB-dependent hemoglobin/transferrin/lactoferrin family receptor [Tardiphaga robiniae]
MITTIPAFGQNNVEATATASTTYPLNISAKPLAAAIADLGASSGWRILYTIQLAPDIRSQPLNGNYTVAQALGQLLAGTGITYRITGPKAALLIDPSQSRAGPVPSGDGVQLDTIVVDAARSDNTTGSGYQGTPDWVYQRPAAVSVISREAIESSPTRNARDLLDNVAGVYANRSAAQNPGISVNIRGLQDQDRIATMIDGARQNFQRGGHGATQRTYVDTAFLRQIDVEKSTTSGVGSAGALGGLVNFRTFIADDLIKPGNQYGGVVNATTGTNAYNFDGSTAAAVRVSERFSVLGGVSYKNIGAYDIGQNGTIGDGMKAYDGNVFLFSGQEVFSTILKAEALTTEDVKITIGWLHNDSRYNTGNYDDTIARGGILKSSEQVANDTFTSAVDWNPGNDIVDLKAKLYYNHLKNDTVSDGAFALTGPSNFVFSTLGGSVENTSRFATGIGALALNYGVEAFSDTGKTTLQRGFVAGNGVDYSSTLTGGTPSGNRDVASGFGTATLKPAEWVTLIGGVRYDWYHVAGNATIYGESQEIVGQRMTNPGRPAICNARGCGAAVPPTYVPIVGTVYRPYNLDVDKSGGAWLPNFTVAFQPVDWLQPFVKYSKSYRPPTIMESFLNGGHDANEINGYAPNPFLRPERGDTYEAGFNVLANGILTERDTVRFKAVGFYREITDYISFGRIENANNAQQYTSYVNLNGVTRMKGVEVEANYDARFLYIGGTVTRIDTDFADSFTSPTGRDMPINSGLGAPVIFEQPKLRVTLDAGIRLFDEKLTLGTRIVDVSKTVPALGSLRSGYEMPGYRVYDIYGSYAFDEATKLRFAVNNVTDLAYAPAVGANFYAAPGRTATVSLNYKF